ncbi:MAG: hypothetical protein N5P05_002695 [Chroococcopsis gigantea SAG 12.99]|nr:hypothetical protein [Chroococcopsis gigantea SAG 12.99]
MLKLMKKNMELDNIDKSCSKWINFIQSIKIDDLNTLFNENLN